MRILISLFLFIAAFLAVASAILYLAYGATSADDCGGALAGLAAPVAVSLQEPGVTRIEAASEADAYRALGVMQACRSAWTMVLLRQTAAGRLSEWFGPATLPLDRFTRKLGLAATARAAYEQLDPSDRAVLDAYAAGVRQALARREIRGGDQFALLNLSPEPWEPWHALMAEQTLHWLAGPPLELPVGFQSADAEAFVAGDRLLRSWLGINHSEESLVWANAGRDETSLFIRLVWGHGALSFADEVVLSWPGRRTWGIAGPGWPAFRAGRSDSLAWGFLLANHAEFMSLSESEGLFQPRYERIRTAPDGDEELVVAFESERHILLGRAATLERPDSLFDVGVSWPSKRAMSAWPAFRRLLNGEGTGSVDPAGCSGALMTREGAVRLVGDLPVRTAGNALLITRSVFADDLAVALGEYGATGNPATPASGTTSKWAGRVTPRLLGLLRRSPERHDDRLSRMAVGYLEAWDYGFDVSSIGATLFDRWTVAMGGVRGRRWESDSTGVETARALQRVVEDLAAEFGGELSRWRWEDTQPSRLHFPVWSSDLLAEAGVALPATRLYQPLRIPRSGHPSTLAYGPSSDPQSGPAPAVWSGWVSTGQWDAVSVTARPPRSSGFLDRFRGAQSAMVEVTDLSPGVRHRTITLYPAVQ